MIIGWLRKRLIHQFEPCTVLYPHKRFPGYYIDISERSTVYSIKSGKLKPLSKKKWDGKWVSAISHNGKQHTVVLDNILRYADLNSENTLLLTPECRS